MANFRDNPQLDAIVQQRLEKARGEIAASLKHIADGNPLAAEPSETRRVARLQSKAALSRAEAEMVSRAIDAAAEQARGAEAAAAMAARPPGPEVTMAIKPPGPEAIQGTTLDFVGVAFLEIGRHAANAVARVAFRNGRPQGSGFLVAPGLFLTNHHVIPTPGSAASLCLEFDYELDLANVSRTVTSFVLDPSRCFVTDTVDGLDYTLVGVGQRLSGPGAIESFGYIPLSDAPDKHMLGEVANLIQHPAGRFKEIVLRENRLVARDETVQVLHYIADTEQGSSGSPVFNNDWEPIALHHWGGPYLEVVSRSGKPLTREINEGIRISAVVKDLRRRSTDLSGPNASAVRTALQIWESQRRPEGVPGRSGRVGAVETAPTGQAGARQNADGSVTWTFPIEINVRAPLLGGKAAPLSAAEPPATVAPRTGAEAVARWKIEDFSDRAGYEPGFIPGFVVPLPTLADVPGRAAENQLAEEGDDAHELRYHHFSIVINAERRLAYFTACNIDGKRIKAVVRDDKTVITDPTLKDLGVESIGAEGAEASDDFMPDRRVLIEEQMTKPFYEQQRVPGFPDPQSRERIARMFQKGHIIMRGDPAWGSEDDATAAERDTFFYTNAAPQVGFFNQGSRLDRPGSKGKLRWRAVETYVLRNAVTMRKRITVFAGPIFDDEHDPSYRFDSKVPMRFWKIAVWAEQGELRSIALLADQKPVLKVMPEAIDGAPEAFGDSLELARVSEFLSTVTEIESLTGLRFAKVVRDADIRAGAESMRPVPAQDLEPEQLSENKPTRARKRRRKPR